MASETTYSEPTWAKAALGYVTLILICTLPLTMCISGREAVPDRAKFLVDEGERIIVPAPLPGRYEFHEVPDRSGEEWDAVISWSDLREPASPYGSYQLPSTAAWDQFEMYGPEVSLLRGWLFPPESRWDSLGYWRY